MFKVIWETLFMCYRGILYSERVIYVNKEEEYEKFCRNLKNMADIFLDYYYFTLRWIEDENYYSQNSLEKYFIMSYIIINHCSEQKFTNNYHYQDFHSRFLDFYDMIEFFYNIVTLNLKCYLKTLFLVINNLLKKDVILKSKKLINFSQIYIRYRKRRKFKNKWLFAKII